MKLQTLRPRIGTAKLSRIPSLTTEANPRKRGSAGVKDRNRIRERDCGVCQECKRQGKTTRGAHVDHIRPLWNGGSDDDCNKELLCIPCHEAKSSREAKERAALG